MGSGNDADGAVLVAVLARGFPVESYYLSRDQGESYLSGDWGSAAGHEVTEVHPASAGRVG
jgi:hypothetical protein